MGDTETAVYVLLSGVDGWCRTVSIRGDRFVEPGLRVLPPDPRYGLEPAVAEEAEKLVESLRQWTKMSVG